MDPFFARNRLSAYVDRTLSDPEAAAVAEAIGSDPELRAEYEQLRRSVEFVRRVGPTEAPAGFHARVMAAVADQAIPKGNVVFLRRFFGRVPVEAVALAAAAIVVVVVIQGRDANHPVTTEPARADEIASAPSTTPLTGDIPTAAQRPVIDATSGSGSGVGRTAPSVAEADPKDAKLAQSSKVSDLGSRSAKSVPTGAKGDETWMDWEEGGVNVSPDVDTKNAAEAVKGAALTNAVTVRMSMADSGALYDLSALAEQNGGRLVDSKGRGLQPRDLTTEDNFARATLVVPVEQRAAVQAALRKMGGSVGASASGTLYGADQAVFVVELNYQP
jgi:anti-sigma factor RsiW